MTWYHWVRELGTPPDSTDAHARLISQVIGEEPRNMKHELKDCDHDGYALTVSDDCIFDSEIRDWCEANVGKYGLTWSWSYEWVQAGMRRHDIFVINDRRAVVSIVFEQEKHAFLFSLRWGDRCVDAK